MSALQFYVGDIQSYSGSEVERLNKFICVTCCSTVDYGSQVGNGDTTVIRKCQALVPSCFALPSRVPQTLSRSEFLFFLYDHLINQSKSVHHISHICLR